ncbi:MAG: S46 family peptidase, partial [Bacteroidota bacterium]|nr:S46 family peptidase [Bacteroidota bacterium]
MIKKITKLLLAFLIVFVTAVKADEGMWIPILLKKYNIEDMQKKGFKLTADDIYSVNQASMKDAVMIFGGGCTAEFVSSQGLLLTNHHCGYGAIQSHSSLEHDYLTNGFWAGAKNKELANPNLSVKLLVRMEDVTDRALTGVNEKMTEFERDELIKENVKGIIDQATKDTHYIGKVKPFFHGNQYFLFIEEVYKDVRLVGTPPSAIGKFGGDTDNWMWPRHTGDFSVFRVYADKDNQPAEYSENNVPFTPKKHFTISTKGYKKNDFTLVFGYPGSTQEYMPSYGVDLTKNVINPERIMIRRSILDIMSEDMEADPAIRIKYASKYAHVSNGWKKWIGENRGLKRLDAVNKKLNYEEKFSKWVDADKERKAKYGKLLSGYKELYAAYTPYKFAENYFYETIWRMESVKLASRIAALSRKGADYTDKDIEKLKKYGKSFFKDYNLSTDKKIFRRLLGLYYNNVEKQFIPEFMEFESAMRELGFAQNYILDLYTEYYFNETFFLNEDKFNEFIKNYTGEFSEIKQSPVYVFYKNFVNMFVSGINPKTMEFDNKTNILDRKYMKAQMEFESDKTFYPDANFTLRVTYGKVDSYLPKDGVFYKHYTTLEGVVEKIDPNIYDYNVPQKLITLFENKDYGRYGENGELHVCFIASNHTSGGNSGSPVINANGELIGINFDRNWEGTMSDIMYDPDQCRNISVDIRYVLFLIDKYAGAGYLTDEMDIV